jgi:hypothetical protein
LKGEDRRVCAGCRICIVHVSFDQRAPPWFRCSLHFSSPAGHKSLLSWPKPRNRPPQVCDWISDLSQHGCLVRFRKLATSRSQSADGFAYFFAPFAKMESDRSNSQDRVAHASDLSTVLVPPGQGPSARLFLRRLGVCLGTTEGPRSTEQRLHHNTRKLCQIFSSRSAFRPDDCVARVNKLSEEVICALLRDFRKHGGEGCCESTTNAKSKSSRYGAIAKP